MKNFSSFCTRWIHRRQSPNLSAKESGVW